MKILTLHTDYIKFKPLKKALKNIADLSEKEKKESIVNNALVVLTAVEKGDADVEEIVKKLIENIKDVAEQVKTKNIVLYPYAHLSSDLASPELALEVLEKAEKSLEKMLGFKVTRAPFGYYKELEFKVKGHPLSELSREITINKGEKIKERKYDSKIKSKGKDSYLILTPEGKEFEVNKYKFKDSEENFKMLVEKEAMKKGLSGGKEPKFIKYAKQFQIEWEPMSDKGHMRYGPSGSLMFNLISDYSEKIAKSFEIPVYSVKGTNMFNLKEKAVKEHADLFGDRLYSIEFDDNKFVLRYAACHQQFAMIKNWNISYKNIPFGALEIADSYRFEQAGELLLAFRTRRMDMPDLHIFCRDFDESKEWFIKIHNKIYEEIYRINDDYEILFNFSSKKNYEDNKKWVLSLLKDKKKNALLHFYPEGINYYWTFNIEYMVIDELKRPREIATVQTDVGNAKRFDIRYKDKDNTNKYPIILHTAILGTIGRYIFALLDNIVRKENKGEIPQLPYWLSPTQIRFLPISDKYNEHAIKLAEDFNNRGIRADVDDRIESSSKKIVDSEKEWVPFTVFVGEKEIKENLFVLRTRGKKTLDKVSKEISISNLRKEQGEMPWRDLPFPVLLSKRPVFV